MKKFIGFILLICLLATGLFSVQAVIPETTMNRVIVDTTNHPEALCNDGSPAVYYQRIDQTTDKWVIFLQGGGFCSDIASCEARWNENSNPMSSLDDDTQVGAGGILSSNRDINPYWYDANKVLINACSSDFWAGDAAGGATPDPAVGDWHFRGRNIIESILADLGDTNIYTTPNLTAATEVMFAGNSAGGVGVLQLADWVRPQLPAAAQVNFLADSGWLRDAAPYDGTLPDPVDDVFQSAHGYWNAIGDVSCESANAAEPWRCFVGEYLYSHIDETVFMVGSQYDAQILDALHGVVLPWDAAETTYVQQFSDDYYAWITTNINTPDDGFYAACSDQHGGYIRTGNFSSENSVNGTALEGLVEDWSLNGQGDVYANACTVAAPTAVQFSQTDIVNNSSMTIFWALLMLVLLSVSVKLMNRSRQAVYLED